MWGRGEDRGSHTVADAAAYESWRCQGEDDGLTFADMYDGDSEIDYEEEHNAILSKRKHVAKKEHTARNGKTIYPGDTYQVIVYRCWREYREEAGEWVWGGPRWIEVYKSLVKRGEKGV
jgi:hypothetical protein